jgi:hypothetical protein
MHWQCDDGEEDESQYSNRNNFIRGDFMAAEKFLQWLNDKTRAVQAVVVGGISNAFKIAALDSTGRWDVSMMPVGIAPETVDCKAKEALDAGDFVNLVLDEGELKAQKADCSNGREPDGFVLSAVNMGATGKVYCEGNNTALTGMTIGAIQYLSTAGDRTETAPASGFAQQIGKAISATEMTFEKMSPVYLS